MKLHEQNQKRSGVMHHIASILVAFGTIVAPAALARAVEYNSITFEDDDKESGCPGGD